MTIKFASTHLAATLFAVAALTACADSTDDSNEDSKATIEQGKSDDPACACPDIWGPVCGDDGKTYANECFAACESATPACEGECPCDVGGAGDDGGGTGDHDDVGNDEPGGGGGGGDCCSSSSDVCGWNGDDVCDEGCAWGTDVDCAGDVPADGCAEIWAPVCTTNGATYSSACFAAVAGETVACDGECPCL